MPLLALLDQALLEAHVHPDFSVTWYCYLLLKCSKLVTGRLDLSRDMQGRWNKHQSDSEQREAEDMRHGNT